MNKWVVSQNEERFDGIETFDTKEEAIEYGKKEYYEEPFFVGKVVSPIQPENTFTADLFLENVSCQEDYECEWAEGWDRSTRIQRAELVDDVRAVIAKWLDKHDLRPRFFNVIEVETIRAWEHKEEKDNAR